MLSTVAVDIPQRTDPANGDAMARAVPGRFNRCPETLEVDGHGMWPPRTEEIADDLPRTAPHRGTERWSSWA
jgi:hypothetical protein